MKLVVILLVFGIIITMTGAIVYIQTQLTPNLRPHGSSPISFGFSARMQTDSLKITFNPLSQNMKIDAQFKLLEAGENHFQIILPYQVREVRADEGSGKWAHKNTMSGSVMMGTFVYNPNSEGSIRVRPLIKIEDSMVQSDRGRYILKLPFGGELPDDIIETRKLFRGASLRGGTFSLDIFIRLPENAFFSSSTHNFLLGRDNDDGSELLHLKMERLEGLPIVQYTVPNEISSYENKLLMAGLLMGIGVPVIISSFVEWMRLRTEKRFDINKY
jgi:hypothetical protein